MKKGIVLSIVIVIIVLIAAFLKFAEKPAVSYEKSMLLDNQNVFETAAQACIEYELEDRVSGEVRIYDVDVDCNNLHSFHHKKDYSLTQEQKQAFQTVDSIFRLDHQGLENIFVVDDFVVFGIVNGGASVIYSASDEKPNFVNSPNEKNEHIFVEKITYNWYYACKQS